MPVEPESQTAAKEGWCGMFDFRGSLRLAGISRIEG